jgi:hypothetical protein
MKNQVELSNLISSLSEEHFKTLIKEYLKEKYKTTQVRIVDGPYDGGNDLEIYIKDKEIKKNVQITVQKNGYEKKIEEDLQKASDNVNKYAYLNQMDFYISQKISKAKRNELEHKSEIDYGITLKIIDSNILSQEAETYQSINNFTYDCHNINVETPSKFDKPTKVLFDVLTHNKNVVEIKKSFIHSHIYSFLYANPSTDADNIFDYVKTQLDSVEKNYIEKELNFLRSKQYIISPSDNKKIFNLSNEKKKDIDTIFSDVNMKEEELKISLKAYIEKKQLTLDCEELLNHLYQLYQENYAIDINEIKNTNDSFSSSLKKTYNDLIKFLTKKGIDEEKAKLYTMELLNLCGENDFLNKLSTVHLFNNLYSSDKLEKYINEQNQVMVLDTQILIRMLCVLYDEKFNSQDMAIQSVKILLSVMDKFKEKIEVFSTYDYVAEVAGHLLEAIKLQKFFSFPFISKLGNSKNVFYNYYLELKQNNRLEDDIDFYEFVNILLDEDIEYTTDEDFLRQVTKKIESLFVMDGIGLVYHQPYMNYLDIKKEYEVSLSYQSKDRTYTAIENDLRTILYLSTKKQNQDETIEPFLITWDSSFYSFRKDLIKKHKELSYWYIYSPLKVVDRLSVMNFNLNPQSINLNIVALTETNFNYTTKKNPFIDVISGFFNTKKDVSKLDIIQKLARLQDDTQDIENMPVYEDFNEKEEDSIITKLLLDVRKHYYSNTTKFKFDDIIELFENKELVDDIVNVFTNAITNKAKTITYSDFDNLITKNKKDAQTKQQ